MKNMLGYTKLLLQVLQQDFVVPPGSPDLHVFRLVDMYTRVFLPAMNKNVLTSFIKQVSKLRIVIATLHLGWALIALI